MALHFNKLRFSVHTQIPRLSPGWVTRASGFAVCQRSMIASRRKSTQVCKTRICVRTCDGWPNGFASRFASRKGRKFHKYTVDLRSTCVDLCWVAKRWSNLRRLAHEFKLDQVIVSQRKWVAKQNASLKHSPGPSWERFYWAYTGAAPGLQIYHNLPAPVAGDLSAKMSQLLYIYHVVDFAMFHHKESWSLLRDFCRTLNKYYT